MPFQRFVETGRIAKCANGPLKGKLVAIVDVIDTNRVLVDGPCTGVQRQAYRMNNLHLTKYSIKFPYTAPTRVIRKAWTDADINAKWSKTKWAQKCKQQKIRANLSDYDRFKLRVAKRSRNNMVTVAFRKLKRYAKNDGTLLGKNGKPRKITLWKDVQKARAGKKGGSAKKATA